MTDTTVDASSNALSASSEVLLRTTSSDGAAKTKKKKSKKRKTVRKKKESATLKFNPNKQEPKYNWVQEVRAELKTQGKRPNSKFTKKKKLSQLVKKKMFGIKFVNCASGQVERHKLQEQKREKDSKKMQVWLKTKKNKKHKKRPKFNLRLYAARRGVTNIHALKVGGMRNPYDLQGVHLVPAERLGAWREENSSGKKKWSSSFHTSEFPAPPNRAQTHKLKNQATARRAVQPRLITFGEYGEIEWFMSKTQDETYQMHAKNMRRLQVARKMLGEQKNCV